MNCLICGQKITPSEQIFFGNQVIYDGPGENDFSYSASLEGLVGAIHLSCLKDPLAVARTPNSSHSEVVKRSDALAILDV